MSELKELPFEHTTVKLTKNLLKGLQREADPPDLLDSYIEYFNEEGITDDLQKLHAI